MVKERVNSRMYNKVAKKCCEGNANKVSVTVNNGHG
jgi:hypothetical protein